MAEMGTCEYCYHEEDDFDPLYDYYIHDDKEKVAPRKMHSNCAKEYSREFRTTLCNSLGVRVFTNGITVNV